MPQAVPLAQFSGNPPMSQLQPFTLDETEGEPPNSPVSDIDGYDSDDDDEYGITWI